MKVCLCSFTGFSAYILKDKNASVTFSAQITQTASGQLDAGPHSAEENTLLLKLGEVCL